MVFSFDLWIFKKNDMLNLANHFIWYGYMEGNGVFYITFENDENIEMTHKFVSTWNLNMVRPTMCLETF